MTLKNSFCLCSSALLGPFETLGTPTKGGPEQVRLFGTFLTVEMQITAYRTKLHCTAQWNLGLILMERKHGADFSASFLHHFINVREKDRCRVLLQKAKIQIFLQQNSWSWSWSLWKLHWNVEGRAARRKVFLL